jgi:hypothetical protein
MDVNNKKNRRWRLSKKVKGLPLGLVVLLAVSLVVAAGLWVFAVQTDVSVEVDHLLFYDGVGAEEITESWDVGNITGGSTYYSNHTLMLSVNSQGVHNVSFTVVDDEDNGFDIQVWVDGVQCDYCVLTPGVSVALQYIAVFDDHIMPGVFTGSVTVA